jgi:hypothetical protein
MQHLPILESLLLVARDKLKIPFDPPKPKKVTQPVMFNPRLSLKKAVELINLDPARAIEKVDETLPINIFLSKLKLKQ